MFMFYSDRYKKASYCPITPLHHIEYSSKTQDNKDQILFCTKKSIVMLDKANNSHALHYGSLRKEKGVQIYSINSKAD